MSKRILITGASGFIGANLARRVLREGNRVHLLLRAGYRPWRLTGIESEVHYHLASLEDREAISALVREVQPDQVFHLAAYGAYSSQQGIERMAATNLVGCAALLDACAETGVEAFVNAGSSSEYGAKDHAPDEEELPEPNSHYAITKLAATHYCRFVARTRNLPVVTLRLYSIYGPWEEPTRLIPTLLVTGLAGKLPPLVSPDIARDFVYVDDAVDALLMAARAPQPGAVYNVCGGRQIALRELVATARRLLSIEAEPAWATMPDRAWDTTVWVGTGARIAKELGWRATTALETGLTKTVEWLKADAGRLHFYRG